MCGIGLWYNKAEPIDSSAFHASMKSINHRGPDFQRIISLDRNLVIGNNRLSIIDDNPRSNQPFQYKEYSLSFNGAIYNYKELRSTLQAKGHEFLTDSDTEVIVHAYEEYGNDCCQYFEGMWAFIIHDKAKKVIYGSRDRFHIKPFYYLKSDKGLFVASEQKQFKYLPGFNYKPNAHHVQLYLESGGFKNHNNETVIQDVLQLEGGHYMEYKYLENKLIIKPYYQLEKKPDLLKVSLKELIKDAVNKRTVGDVQTGVLLSGGIDSSIITSELYQSIKGLKSYSFIEGRDSRMDESPYLKAFLSQYPHENHQIILPDSLEKLIQECIKYQDEPPASLSTFAQYLLYRLAQNNGEKLILSGQGADEIFGGYPRFLSYIPATEWLKNPKQILLTLIDSIKLIGSRNTTNLFSSSVIPSTSYNTEKEYMQFLLFKNSLRDLLHYEDRNSMASGIETRLPFLDKTLVEYAYTISTEEKLQGATRKGILRSTYSNQLPSKITERKTKLAFDTPEKFLLGQDFIDVQKEYDKLRDRLPNIPWKKNKKLIHRSSEFTQWQIYFTNIWLDNL